jgi:uncharacterized protein involved in outer membrane biogenesis
LTRPNTENETLARILVLFGSLIVLAVLAALVVPYFIDWSQYKTRFEAEASRVLGREVKVRGSADAKLFPFPSVRFTDVEVAGGGATEPSLRVGAFSMDLELAPFLSGEILIFDMRIENADALVTIGTDGQIDWAIRPDTGFDPKQITLERIRVTDSKIRVLDTKSFRTHVADALDLTIGADTLAGPWRITGSGRFDGHASQILVSTGAVDNDGAMRARVTVAPNAFPVRFESEGGLGLSEARPRYQGEFKVLSLKMPVDTDRLVGAIDADGGRLSGKFLAGPESVVIDEFRYEIGPADNAYAATGNAAIDIGPSPSFRIEANGDQVRLDEGEDEPVATALPLSARLSALSSALAAVPDAGMPGTINVNLPAIVTGGTTLRDVKLSARPDNGSWRIENASAELPGRSVVEASGMFRPGVSPQFDGDVVVASKQPSGLAAWLGKAVDDRIRRLETAGFQAKVSLGLEQQIFENVEIVGGTTRLTGSIDRFTGDTPRPKLAAILKADTVNLDELTALALLMDAGGEEPIADSHDVDLSLTFASLQAGELQLGGVDTTFRLREPGVEVDKLSIDDLAGASLSATASFGRDFAHPDGKADVSIVGTDLGPLVKLAAARFPDNAVFVHLANRAAFDPALFQDGELTSVISAAPLSGGGEQEYTVTASGVAGGTKFTGTMIIEGTLSSGSTFNLDGSLDNDDATPLLTLAGVEALPFRAGFPLGLDVTAKGSVSGGVKLDVKARGDGLSGDVSGAISKPGPSWAGQLEVNVSAPRFDDLLLVSGVSLPGAGRGGGLDLETSIKSDGTVIEFNTLRGKLGDAGFSGDLAYDILDKDTERRGITGKLAVTSLDALLLAEAVGGASAADGLGDAASRSIGFAQEALIPVDAKVEITADHVGVGPFGALGGASFTLSAEDTAIKIDGLKAAYGSGIIEGALSATNSGAALLFSAQGKLNGVPVELLTGTSANLVAMADINGTISATGRSLDAVLSGLAGSGALTLNEGVVIGLNPDPMLAILAAADEAGVTATDALRASEAAKQVEDGFFPFKTVESAFTIAGGVLRIPPIAVDLGAARLSADMAVTVANGDISGKATVAYTPGERDVVAGAQPGVDFTVSGSRAAPVVTADYGPMTRYLAQRALEREQKRVETMQAILFEKQRLRREVRRVTVAGQKLQAALDLQRAEAERLREEERLQKEEAARDAAEQARGEEILRLLEEGQAPVKAPDPVPQQAPATGARDLFAPHKLDFKAGDPG